MKIIQLGAAFHQSLFIQDCIDLGYEVTTIDNRPCNYGHNISTNSINRSITDAEEIMDCINSEEDIVSAYGSDIAMLTWAKLNNKQNLGILCKKYTARSFLKKCFFNKKSHIQPECYLIENLEELLQKLDSEEKVVIKPNISSGSKGVAIIEGKTKAKECYHEAKNYSLDNKVVVEEYVQNNGKKYFCEGLKIKSKVLFAFGLSTSSSKDLKLDGSILFTKGNCKTYTGQEYLEVYKKLEESLRTIFDKLLLRKSDSIAFNVDFYLEEEKIFIIECAPRPGGNFLSLHLEYIYNIDYCKSYLSIVSPKQSPKIYWRECRFAKSISEDSAIKISISESGDKTNKIFSFPNTILSLSGNVLNVTRD